MHDTNALFAVVCGSGTLLVKIVRVRLRDRPNSVKSAGLIGQCGHAIYVSDVDGLSDLHDAHARIV
jgi:hypothetical protein